MTNLAMQWNYTAPRSNQDILRLLRKGREMLHRRYLEALSIDGIILSSALPLLHITLDHVQDSCNKSVAIYWLDSQPGTVSFYNYIYQQWFRGHVTEIEFGRFISKIFQIKDEATVPEILRIHQAWCEHVVTCRPQLDIEGYDEDIYGWTGINFQQAKFYKLKPLFRALIMIVDNPTSTNITTAAQQVVHLVRTGNVSGLSAPISFDTLKSKTIGSGGNVGPNLITITLSTAIKFIMDLEAREDQALPDTERDMSVLDWHFGSEEAMNHDAKLDGYTGEHIQGPSTDWVQMTEGEEIWYPQTPCSMQDDPNVVWD